MISLYMDSQIDEAARSLRAESGISQSGKKGLITYDANVSPIIAFVVGLIKTEKYMIMKGKCLLFFSMHKYLHKY